jgi:hypothetical protein
MYRFYALNLSWLCFAKTSDKYCNSKLYDRSIFDEHTPTLALHYRFKFAARSLAARQYAALVAVEPEELLCESIQLRSAKRVGSWAGLRDLWRSAALSQLAGLHFGPRR